MLRLFGRLVSAAVADHFGLAANFYVFAFVKRATPMPAGADDPRSPLAYWGAHLRNGPLCASFGIGFLIPFTFIGTFTYVNFVLVRQPLGLSPMELGFVYFAFLPAILTTPLAGKVAQRFGTRPTF